MLDAGPSPSLLDPPPWPWTPDPEPEPEPEPRVRPLVAALVLVALTVATWALVILGAWGVRALVLWVTS